MSKETTIAQGLGGSISWLLDFGAGWGIGEIIVEEPPKAFGVFQGGTPRRRRRKDALRDLIAREDEEIIELLTIFLEAA